MINLSIRVSMGADEFTGYLLLAFVVGLVIGLYVHSRGSR